MLIPQTIPNPSHSLQTEMASPQPPTPNHEHPPTLEFGESNPDEFEEDDGDEDWCFEEDEHSSGEDNHEDNGEDSVYELDSVELFNLLIQNILLMG